VLNPHHLASQTYRPRTSSRTIRETKWEVAAGVLGASADTREATAFHLLVQLRRAPHGRAEFSTIIVRARERSANAAHPRCRAEWNGFQHYALRSIEDNKPGSGLNISQGSGLETPLQDSKQVARHHGNASRNRSQKGGLTPMLRPDGFVDCESIQAVGHNVVEACSGRACGLWSFCKRARVHFTAGASRSRLIERFNHAAFGFRLILCRLDWCWRWMWWTMPSCGRERRATDELGHEPHERYRRAMEEVSGPIVAIALVAVRVSSHGIHRRAFGRFNAVALT